VLFRAGAFPAPLGLPLSGLVLRERCRRSLKANRVLLPYLNVIRIHRLCSPWLTTSGRVFFVRDVRRVGLIHVRARIPDQRVVSQ